jgi:hypothetical protein
MKKLADVPPETVRKQLGHPAEEDLQRWSHHHGVSTVNDEVLRQAGDGFVSFVFGLEVEGKDIALFAQEDEEKRAAAAAAKAAGACMRVHVCMLAQTLRCVFSLQTVIGCCVCTRPPLRCLLPDTPVPPQSESVSLALEGLGLPLACPAPGQVQELGLEQGLVLGRAPAPRPWQAA